MRFFSDNAAAACPEVMAAIVEANRLDTAYDGDAWSKRLNAAFSELFEREVEALWVATGTAANSLALAALCPPYGGSSATAAPISRSTNAARRNSTRAARNCCSAMARARS